MQPFHKIHVVTFAANGMPTFTSLLMIAAKKITQYSVIKESDKASLGCAAIAFPLNIPFTILNFDLFKCSCLLT